MMGNDKIRVKRLPAWNNAWGKGKDLIWKKLAYSDCHITTMEETAMDEIYVIV